MKYQHQNSIQRIRKNYFHLNSYNSGNHAIHSALPYSYYTGTEVNVFNTFVNGQIEIILNKKVKENKSIKELIISRVGEEAFSYIEHFVNVQSQNTLIVSKVRQLAELKDSHDAIVSLQSFNSIKNIDSFLCQVNENILQNGQFIGFVETNQQRKQNQWVSQFSTLTKIASVLEFTVHRFCPKIIGLKQIYFTLTQGRFQRLSKAEVLGRLVKYGFKIVELEEAINGKMYFVVKKIKSPDVTSPASNGILYKFPRVGQNGKIIGVYKIRTMHPYSEYLQDYIINRNGYGADGKPANDFRVPAWAKFVRRYWLDELPQLINVFKGEMKLFGVRPVTDRYFQDIPKRIQKLRLSHKPGCIPPYVAFNKSSSKDSVLAAEEDYLNSNNHGFLADLKYISMAIKNIIFNKKRGS